MENIFKVSKTHYHTLAGLRLNDSWQIAEEEDFFWLKTNTSQMQPGEKLISLPAAQCFYSNNNKHLFLQGASTPVALLKEMRWQSLKQFITVEPPLSAFSGLPGPASYIKLVLSQVPRQSRALLTELTHWKKYVEDVPGFKIAHLQFSVSEKKQVLVIGDLLPSIPGKEFWQEKELLIPAGYAFEFELATQFICLQLSKNKDALILFNNEGNFETIEKTFFVKATRSATRLTNA